MLRISLFTLYFIFLFINFGNTQTPTANDLLQKSIRYHDPNNLWLGWQGEFAVELEMADLPTRVSRIDIDNAKGEFYLITEEDGHLIERGFRAGECITLIDRKVPDSKAISQKYKLNCERAEMYRDYYTYLYGLPMKLRDKGTILSEKVESVNWKGNNYWRLKVNYEEAVGKDTWYFYFDKNNYALKAYQFYHNESANDGEYILLKGEVLLNGIRLPKDRTWYYNTDDKLLGTDYLKVQN